MNLELLHKAEALCARAEYSPSDIREKLYRWGCQERDEASAIIRQLQEDGYINDDRYCRAFVHDKVHYQGWGRVKIRLALEQKRLPDNSIEEALSNIDEDVYLDKLRQAISTKSRQCPQSDPSRREKIIRFCLQRGFEYELIAKTIRQYDDGTSVSQKTADHIYPAQGGTFRVTHTARARGIEKREMHSHASLQRVNASEF